MDILATLKHAAEALTIAATGISKFTDIINHLKPLLSHLVSSRVEEERNRLKALSEYLVELGYETNVVTVNSIDAYLKKDHPSQADWRRVKKALHGALTKVHAILSDLRREESDFRLEDCYKSLRESLFSREVILDDLLLIEQPKSHDELLALSEVNTRYKTLIAQLREAVKSFDNYIKQMPKS